MKVKVQDGWVTLTGTVDWQFQGAAAEAAIRKLTGVVGVTDQIGLRAASVAHASEVERKIKDALERNAELEANAIHISVRNGDTVMLDGKVHAWNERWLAERAAWSVPGVRMVEDRPGAPRGGPRYHCAAVHRGRDRSRAIRRRRRDRVDALGRRGAGRLRRGACPARDIRAVGTCSAHSQTLRGRLSGHRAAGLRRARGPPAGASGRGRARVTAIETAPGVAGDEVLRLAASLDQFSQHVIAGTVVEAAHARDLALAMPAEVEEEPGAGITGLVDGRRVVVGSHACVAARAAPATWGGGVLRRMGYEGATGAFVVADGRMLGAILLAAAAMVVAALGFLPPVAGALLQEVIDVAAILNALRVLRVHAPGRPRTTLPAADIARLKAEHEHLAGLLGRLRAVADQLATLPPREAIWVLAEAEALVRERLLRHERDDDAHVYPMIERALGGDDPIAAMHRAHREVQQLGGLLGRMVADLPPEGLDQAAANDFRRVLYGLDAILRLHFAQEDEMYHGLAESA